MSVTAITEEIRHIAETRLRTLLDEQSSVYGALLSSIDGHRQASAMHKDLHTSKLATMTSSVIALGESLAKEAEQSQCQFVIVQNRDGYIVTQRLGTNHALTVFATATVSLGMLLSTIRIAAEDLHHYLA